MSNTQNNTFVSTTSNITNWSSIDWKKAEKYVDKIQKRIYRAESEGDYRKVRDLQRLLGRSAYVQLLAIRRVTQTNKGKRTAGIDGFRALSDKQRMDLFYKIRNRNINLHKPKPALRKYIEKKNGKMRPLSIPVILDRIYQEILRMALEPQWEFRFEPTSYGFRPKRSIHDAAERIFNSFIIFSYSSFILSTALFIHSRDELALHCIFPILISYSSSNFEKEIPNSFIFS